MKQDNCEINNRKEVIAEQSRNTKVSGTRVWVCLICWTLLFSCKPSEPIRIGFVGGTSGRVADMGIAGRDAAQLAIDQRNSTGGISGRKVRLIFKNDEQKPSTAKRVLRELISEEVSAIVGPMTSDMGIVMAPIASKAKVVLVAPTVTTEKLTGIDDYFFRVISTTRHFASRNAQYQVKSNRMRRVAAAYDLINRSFSENWLANFRTAFNQENGKIIKAQGFESGSTTNFHHIAKNLLEEHPDGVVIIANSMDSALLCHQIRKLDEYIPITLSDWGAGERFLKLGGRKVEGVSVVQTFDRNSSASRYLDFRKAYMSRFHREPGAGGVYAYDATNVVLDALDNQKGGRNLKETILAIRHFEGLQSRFSFDDFGDVKRPHASISVVRDGKFVVVE